MQSELVVRTTATGAGQFVVHSEIHTASYGGIPAKVQELSRVLVDLQDRAVQEALGRFGYVKTNPSQEQCASAWAAVADKLGQIFSNWTDFAPTGLEAALRAIQKLADEGHPEVYQEYKAMRRRCADLEQQVAKYKADAKQLNARLIAVKEAVIRG